MGLQKLNGKYEIHISFHLIKMNGVAIVAVYLWKRLGVLSLEPLNLNSSVGIMHVYPAICSYRCGVVLFVHLENSIMRFMYIEAVAHQRLY